MDGGFLPWEEEGGSRIAPASECRVVRGRQRPRRECDDLGVQICGRREAVAGQASRQRKHASPSEEARQGSAQTWHPGEVPLLLDRSRRRSRQRHSLRRRLLFGPRTRRHLLLGPCLHRCLLLLGPRLRRCLLLDPRLRFRRHRVRRPLGDPQVRSVPIQRTYVLKWIEGGAQKGRFFGPVRRSDGPNRSSPIMSGNRCDKMYSLGSQKNATIEFVPVKLF